jgi:hypothetical protein
MMYSEFIYEYSVYAVFYEGIYPQLKNDMNYTNKLLALLINTSKKFKMKIYANNS